MPIAAAEKSNHVQNVPPHIIRQRYKKYYNKKVMDKFSELCEARILIGDCVSEAELLFEALLAEAQQLSSGEDREFVLAGMHEGTAVETLAHVIAVNRSGGHPTIVALANTHDIRNKIAYLTHDSRVLLNCDPKAWEGAAIVNMCTAAWETMEFSADTERRIQSLILRVRGSKLITAIHHARTEVIQTITQNCLQNMERPSPNKLIPRDQIIIQATEHGLDSLPLLELHKLLNDHKRLQQLAGIVKSRDDSNVGTRHQSWDAAMLDLITDDDPTSVL